MNNLNHLEVSLSDLRSSVVLFSSKNYPQAVFYMQQSVEKFGKYLALSYGVHNEKDLKRIGHNTIKIYKDVLLHFLDLINRLSDKYDFEALDLTPVHEQFNIITNGDLLHLMDEDLDSLLDSLSEAKTTDLIFDLRKDKSELLQEFLELTAALDEISEDEVEKTISQYETDPIIREILNEKLENFLNTFPEYISASISAFYLAIAFSKHAVHTRYIQENQDPLSEYTIENPLVSRIPEFQQYLEKSLIRCINFEKAIQ